MKTYVILFRQGPHPLTAAELTARQRATSAWAEQQNAAGHRLDPRILSPDAMRPLGDEGVGIEAWPITALLFLEAVDLAEASRVAASHPANNYNARVEVRPWSAPSPPVAIQPSAS